MDTLVTSKSDIVIKANNLIEGFIDMTQNEYKFTLYLISKINKDDTEFRKVRVTVKEFAELLSIKGKYLYDYMKEFEHCISKKVVRVLYPNGDRISVPWFGYLKYIENEGMLEVAFNYHLSPYLLELELPYTKYLLDNIKSLQSIHSIRIYELLKQYENTYTKERIIDIEALKDMLGIPSNEYKLYADFKRRVLLKSQEEINNKTDIKFNFEEIKHVRKIKAVKFIIKSTTTKITILENSKNESITIEEVNQIGIDEILDDTKVLIKTFKKQYSGNLDHNILKNMINKYGLEHVQNCLKDFNEYITFGKIDGIEGLFIRHIQGKLKKPTSYQSKAKQLHNFEQKNFINEDMEKFYSNNKKP